jgi:hypothetical protein
MERDTLLKMWQQAVTDGLWHAPWSKAVDGLTPAQAAWKPGPDRHSIWQLVHHIIFWREVTLRTIDGSKPATEEVDRRNWAEPPVVTASALREAVERFAETHGHIRQAISDGRLPADKVYCLLAHDSYHVGQIMYVRAMQGLPAIE